MQYSPSEMLPRLYDYLLDVIACERIEVRPGRLEPRAIVRQRQHYPYLRITRSKWRERRFAGLPEVFYLS